MNQRKYVKTFENFVGEQGPTGPSSGNQKAQQFLDLHRSGASADELGDALIEYIRSMTDKEELQRVLDIVRDGISAMDDELFRKDDAQRNAAP